MSSDQNYQHPMRFTGEGAEYFKIWTVNIVLTILTLGIYSAWAKVRTNRWFYGHTYLGDQSFNYLATPMQILKGRLIAVALVVIYYIASVFYPVLAAIMIFAVMLVMPWLIVNGMKFGMAHTSYRGLRFRFTGKLGESYVNFFLLPMLISFTLGLILPYIAYRQVKYIAENTVYGDTQNEYYAEHKNFWRMYLIAFGIMIIPIVGLFGVIFAGAAMAQANPESASSLVSVLFLVIPLFYGAVLLAGAVIRAHTANLLYNASQLGPVEFVSTQRGRDLAWIYFSNLVLIALTLGLFIPWAKVRLARYRAEHLVIEGPEDLDSFVAGQTDNTSANASEMADVLDMDIGIA